MKTLLKQLFKKKRKSLFPNGAYVDPSAQIIGWKQLDLGEGCVIGESCCVNINNRKTEDKSVSIGKFTYLGRRAFLTSGKKIEIGPYCTLSVDCHLLGSAHFYSDPFRPYLTTGTSEGSIRIGANSFLGAGVTCVAECEIGHGSVIGAAALVRGTIPPFSLVAGNPAKIIRRYSVSLKRWVKPEEFSPEMESALPTESEYLTMLSEHDPECWHHVKGARLASSSYLGELK